MRLLRSVARGDLSTVKHLFAKRGKALLSIYGLDGCTPFLLACKKGHTSVASYLIEQGASIADRDKDPKRQGNAIHYASWGGSLSTVLWLLTRGASLDDVDIVGNTPLLYAIYGGHKDVVEELVRRGRSLREKNTKNHTAILQVLAPSSTHACLLTSYFVHLFQLLFLLFSFVNVWVLFWFTIPMLFHYFLS